MHVLFLVDKNTCTESGLWSIQVSIKVRVVGGVNLDFSCIFVEKIRQVFFAHAFDSDSYLDSRRIFFSWVIRMGDP